MDPSSLREEWYRLLLIHKTLLKAKREFIRSRRWSEGDWYKNWPQVGDALEAVLRKLKK